MAGSKTETDSYVDHLNDLEQEECIVPIDNEKRIVVGGSFAEQSTFGQNETHPPPSAQETHAPHAPHGTHAPEPTHAPDGTQSPHAPHPHGSKAPHGTKAPHATKAPHGSKAPHTSHGTHSPHKSNSHAPVPSTTSVAPISSSGKPTTTPTSAPRLSPTDAPMQIPSEAPTVEATALPSVAPSSSPTDVPTLLPSEAPSVQETASPSAAPSPSPTDAPTLLPTGAPSLESTTQPTDAPVVNGTFTPTSSPSILCDSDEFDDCFDKNKDDCQSDVDCVWLEYNSQILNFQDNCIPSACDLGGDPGSLEEETLQAIEVSNISGNSTPVAILGDRTMDYDTVVRFFGSGLADEIDNRNPGFNTNQEQRRLEAEESTDPHSDARNLQVDIAFERWLCDCRTAALIIPYTYDPALKNDAKVVESSINLYTQKGVFLVDRATLDPAIDCDRRMLLKDHIRFVVSDVTTAPVGKGPGPISFVRIEPRYIGKPFVALHEAMHVLGFDHEHNRPDRLSWIIEPEWVNIKGGKSNLNYVLEPNYVRSEAYDMRSIMHYGAFQHPRVAIDPKYWTLKERNIAQTTFGVRDISLTLFNDRLTNSDRQDKLGPLKDVCSSSLVCKDCDSAVRSEPSKSTGSAWSCRFDSPEFTGELEFKLPGSLQAELNIVEIKSAKIITVGIPSFPCPSCFHCNTCPGFCPGSIHAIRLEGDIQDVIAVYRAPHVRAKKEIDITDEFKVLVQDRIDNAKLGDPIKIRLTPAITETNIRILGFPVIGSDFSKGPTLEIEYE